MLFSPDQHEPLSDTRWDDACARDAIAAIVAETESAFDPETLWPVHPRDEPAPAWERLGVYLGAAGVIWALDELARAGTVGLRRDYAPTAERLHAVYLASVGDDPPRPGIWMGEVGMLLVAQRLRPSTERAQLIYDAVARNLDSETNELMWGNPGTMLAAQAMLEWTGEERWRELWQAGAVRLWDEWRFDEELGCHVWTQQLYGKTARYVGPAHGFAGNVRVLARGKERREELARRAAATAEQLAVREDGLANWVPLAGGPLLSPDGVIRVQWCHGAPGVVASLAGLLADDLLAAGGELTWVAGPLAKGPGLCHGTAGNGLAFLKLFEQTGDERWLARARAFAAHAIEQVDRERAEHGRGRFSLWTGDVGVALYLERCRDGDAAVPTIDVW